MTKRLSPEDYDELINSIPHALTLMSPSSQLGESPIVNVVAAMREDDPGRLSGATRALCDEWTNIFPEGFNQERDDHLDAVIKLCQRFCDDGRWHRVFNYYWRTHPISLRTAVIQLTADHNKALASAAARRQELTPARGSSEAAVHLPVAATNDQSSEPAAGTKRKRGDIDEDDDDDDETLVASHPEPEQQLLDELSTWTSKISEFLQHRTQQHDQELSKRDARVKELEGELGQKDHDVVQKNSELIQKNDQLTQQKNELVQKSNELARKDDEAAALSATIETQKNALNEELLKRDCEHSHTILKLKEEKSQAEQQLKTSTNEATKYLEEVKDLKHSRDRHAIELQRLQRSLDVRTKEVDRLQADLDAIRKEKERTHRQLVAANAEKDRVRLEAEAARRGVTQLRKEKLDVEDRHGDLLRRANDAEGRLRAVKDLLDPRRGLGGGDGNGGGGGNGGGDGDDRGTVESGRAERGRKRK